MPTTFPVLFKPSQCRRKDVAVHLLRENSVLCYEYMWKRSNGDGSQTYVCRACCTLKKKAQKSGTSSTTNYGLAPSIKIVNGRFMEDPENPTNPHFCEPYEASTVLIRREQLATCQALRGKGETKMPKEAEKELQELINRPEYARLSEKVREEIMEKMKQLAFSEKAKKNFARQVQRNRKATEPVTEKTSKRKTESLEDSEAVKQEIDSEGEEDDDNSVTIDNATLLEMMIMFNTQNSQGTE